MSTIKVRVKEGSVIPYTIKLRNAEGKKVPHTFEPDCEVEAAEFEKLQKAYPGRFMKATGTADKNKYTISTTKKEAVLKEVVAKLGPDDQLAVLNYAKAKLDGEDTDDYTVAELTEKISRLDAKNIELEKDLAAAKANAGTAADPQYSKWTMDALRDEAKAKGLTVAGNASKDEVIAALVKG